MGKMRVLSSNRLLALMITIRNWFLLSYEDFVL